MDASCFNVDWMTQTLRPSMAQSGGSWSHILTCAHVICPWQYPNYYPTTGPTRFVSRISLPDTMTQIRVPSLQGQPVFKHFTSNHTVFVHSNPRLDLCVVHPEQNLKRSGENKMMWLQNEGLAIRPRLEITEELNVGDYVWIYGVTAHETLFDEEKGSEPLMVPTGVRGRVHAKTREHFFVDTLGVEGSEKGKISMGMCGSVVMRGGKCVGMLTATVHEDSTCKELAGCAMCTYSVDIFEFLLEVEKQMKNVAPQLFPEETSFQAKRKEEGKVPPQNRDWSLEHTRLARHIKVPVSLWRMEEKWMTEEDVMSNAVFGRSGVFNQDTQESALGYDMNSSTSQGDRPDNIGMQSTQHQSGKHYNQGERPDTSPTGIYGNPEEFKTKDQFHSSAADDVRSLFNDAVSDPTEAALLDALRRNLEQSSKTKNEAQMRETVMKHTGRNRGTTDPLNVGSAGHYGGSRDAGERNFAEEVRMEDEKLRRYHQREFVQQHEHDVASQEFSSNRHRSEEDSASNQSTSTATTLDAKAKRRMERQEKERKYQEELRRRHAPIGGMDKDGMSDIWGQH